MLWRAARKLEWAWETFIFMVSLIIWWVNDVLYLLYLNRLLAQPVQYSPKSPASPKDSLTLRGCHDQLCPARCGLHLTGIILGLGYAGTNLATKLGFLPWTPHPWHQKGPGLLDVDFYMWHLLASMSIIISTFLYLSNEKVQSQLNALMVTNWMCVGTRHLSRKRAALPEMSGKRNLSLL